MCVLCVWIFICGIDFFGDCVCGSVGGVDVYVFVCGGL